jgi:hypothetical protein
MKELEVKAMLADNRIPEQYKRGSRLSSEFLDGVDYAEQRIMEKGVRAWLMRDEKNLLYVFCQEPPANTKIIDHWFSNWLPGHIEIKDDALFPEVTFENSPVKARIVLED